MYKKGRDKDRYRNEPGRKEYIIRKVSEHRKRNRKRLIEIKGGACEKCGYSRSTYALDFHHVNPETKKFNLTVTNMTKAWHKVLAEAEKCILVCANCHREIEAGIRKVG